MNNDNCFTQYYALRHKNTFCTKKHCIEKCKFLCRNWLLLEIIGLPIILNRFYDIKWQHKSLCLHNCQDDIKLYSITYTISLVMRKSSFCLQYPIIGKLEWPINTHMPCSIIPFIHQTWEFCNIYDNLFSLMQLCTLLFFVTMQRCVYWFVVFMRHRKVAMRKTIIIV